MLIFRFLIKIYYYFRCTRCLLPDINSKFCRRYSRATGAYRQERADQHGAKDKIAQTGSTLRPLEEKFSLVTRGIRQSLSKGQSDEDIKKLNNRTASTTILSSPSISSSLSNFCTCFDRKKRLYVERRLSRSEVARIAN